MLFYNEKIIFKNNEVKKIVKEAFDKSKSAGYKKIRTTVAASYTGLSNKKILEISKGDTHYKQANISNLQPQNESLKSPTRLGLI